jgi:hypothetical protein
MSSRSQNCKFCVFCLQYTLVSEPKGEIQYGAGEGSKKSDYCKVAPVSVEFGLGEKLASGSCRFPTSPWALTRKLRGSCVPANKRLQGDGIC